MKVAYLSCYRDGTGYSKAAIENIMSLDTVGIEVVPRSLKMTNTNGSVPDRINELEKGDLLGVDIVFQHNLPDQFCYKGGVINVGAFAYETSGFPNTNWSHHLKLMDRVIVFCNQQKAVVVNECGHDFINKTRVVPHAVDIDKFDKQYDLIDFGLPKNTIKFYTIAEYGRRKNLPALLAAYFSKFSSDDNVVLVIKTHMPNRDPVTAANHVKGMIDDLRRGMGRFSSADRYPKVILLTEYMTDSQILSLHRSCDIFVTASHGESFCLPAADALGFGNPVIGPKHGAFKDYIVGSGLLVDGIESPVFGVTDCPQGLYTADETWFNIGIDNLGNAMVAMANDINIWLSSGKRSLRNQFVKNNLSRAVVGEKLKLALEIEVGNAK